MECLLQLVTSCEAPQLTHALAPSVCVCVDGVGGCRLSAGLAAELGILNAPSSTLKTVSNLGTDSTCFVLHSSSRLLLWVLQGF